MTHSSLPRSPFQLEVCVDSLRSALAAEAGGAARLELCSALALGGLTPSTALISMVKERTNTPLHVLIRPRAGDFCYSDDEFELMQQEVQLAKQLDVDGVVLGLLRPNGSIDVQRTKQLIELAAPLSVTFHRASDLAVDPFQSLEDIISLRIDRLLTSGQAVSAFAGRELLAKLVKQAAGRISIMPGGGISESNIAQLVAETAVHECHASARKQFDSSMQYRRQGVAMGAAPEDEHSVWYADAGRVRAMIEAVTGVSSAGA